MTAALSSSINPVTSIAATFGSRIGVVVPWRPPDPLNPVMAAPTFSQPMYGPLFNLSPDWLLSGFDQLPSDVASLAHPNERFRCLRG